MKNLINEAEKNGMKEFIDDLKVLFNKHGIKSGTVLFVTKDEDLGCYGHCNHSFYDAESITGATHKAYHMLKDNLEYAMDIIHAATTENNIVEHMMRSKPISD